MAHNRYYIVDASDDNLEEIIKVSVGNLYSQRYNLDGTKLVIKLCEGDHDDYPFLDGYTEYNHDDILIALNTDEWRLPA